MFEQQAATVNCYLIETSCQESPLSAIADKGGSLKVFSGWLGNYEGRIYKAPALEAFVKFILVLWPFESYLGISESNYMFFEAGSKRKTGKKKYFTMNTSFAVYSLPKFI